MIHYKEFTSSKIEEVKELYQKVSWKTYLQDDPKLIRAFDQSLSMLGAFHEEQLIAFIRCVGDGEHILMVQDLVVDPEFQQRGIGTHLFNEILSKYSNVRMFVVLTDIEDLVDNKFYQSFQLVKLEEKHMVGYIRP